ncbi:tetratricopeptide repeat protein 13-like [Ylistrum balloti]|uniref:tetratricopeptide repeat protein 13-like n=1 Tax=Ylistrum balloti TaxID=509963 RepID=UPI002905A519|nr:tetratricopeptide repeat protein 13-like [Ylistrum balloti]
MIKVHHAVIRTLGPKVQNQRLNVSSSPMEVGLVDDMAVRLLLFVFSCIVLGNHAEQSCGIANVQVENEDGTTQVFEVKRLEPVKGESCSLCTLKPVNFVPRLTALESNVFLAVGEVVSQCDDPSADLPEGLCSSFKDTGHCSKDSVCSHEPEDLADVIVKKGFVPMSTGDVETDKQLALGIVLMNSGSLEESIKVLLTVIRDKPETLAAYYILGIAHVRRGVQERGNAVSAMRDFTEAIKRSTTQFEPYARRAELHLALKDYDEALRDLIRAEEFHPDSKVYFMRGIIHLLLENFVEAEDDFKMNLKNEDHLYLASYYHLGLTLYYRGKIRNAIEVFKEVLKIKPDFVDASTSLAQAFRELGNLRASRAKFNHSLNTNPSHSQTLQLRGNMLYHSGETVKAAQDFKKCLEIDPENINCQYMLALCDAAMGRFYESVKSTTKVMVKNSNVMRASPEFLKAHYLREYVRYLHSHLDQPITDLKLDEDLSEEFRDHWAKLLPFQFRNAYKEQPGLQPDIKDVVPTLIKQYPTNIQNLICKADKIGMLTQVNTDGYTPNRKLNMAMGLASIHISQILEARWKGLRQNKQMERSLTWREIFDVAVKYRRLVDPEQAVLWLDTMPDHTTDGYRTDISFIRGSVYNVKVLQYFDLVFKLGKTMLEHFSGEGSVTYSGLKDDIEKAKTCEDLLDIAKKRQINQQGFLVATQVPSSRRDNKDDDRLDGSMLVLTRDINHKVLFSMNVVNRHARTMAYHAELDSVFNQLQEEIKRTGVTKVTDVDSVLNIILTLAYYFYNLMPLSRGSSAVAYSVALGVIMSIGRQVTGKMPNGKLVEMEAMLSGAPDVFILMSKQWMNIKRLNIPTSLLPKVYEAFPTTRNVIEVLNVNTDACQ